MKEKQTPRKNQTNMHETKTRNNGQKINEQNESQTRKKNKKIKNKKIKKDESNKQTRMNQKTNLLHQHEINSNIQCNFQIPRHHDL